MQQIGETRSALGEDFLAKKIEKVINDAERDKPSLKQYWIVYSAQPDKLLWNVIRDTFKVTNIKPPKMLNSMCFYVDVTKGMIRPEWILPMDLGSSCDHLIGREHSSVVGDSLGGDVGILS